MADPTDLKTLAQFNLLGDPSLHPVQAVAPAGEASVTPSSPRAYAKARTDSAALRAASRPQRRQHLAVLGRLLGSAVAAVDSKTKRAAAGNAKTFLEEELKKQGATTLEISSFEVKSPKLAAGKVRARAVAAPNGRVDVAVGELPQQKAPFKRLFVVVARHVGTEMIVRHLYSR